MTSQQRFVWILSVFFAAILFSSCQEDKTPTPTAAAPAETWFDIPLQGQPIRAQVMLQTHELARGLMHRESLGEFEGMIFLYPRPQRMSFYMRNTRIPLDIGYFTSDGTLREIYKMFPYDESSVPSKSEAIQIALEVNQGWFARHQVKPGAKLDLAALENAIRQRGEDPVRFGLPAK